MFPNLRAEQARMQLTNQMVADILGISRATYEYKKKTGHFNVDQSRQLCELFKCEFSYLFGPEEREAEGGAT